MSSSPNSNASSSDLYSPSDNPELIFAHPAVTAPLEKEDFIPLTESHISYRTSHTNDQPVEPTAEIGQGIVEPGKWDPDRTDSSMHNLPNGQDSSYHKRKRDDFEDPQLDFRGHTSLSISSRDGQDSGRSDQNDGPPKKRQLVPEHWSRISRSESQADLSPSVGSGRQVQFSGLPDEIWQHIFSFVPPVFLGRLLSVNQVFHGCLTKANGEPRDQARYAASAVRPVSADSVWAASRKRFAPGLPKPLRGLQELDMWRLLRGRPCQLCGETKTQNFATSAESPLESGPGDKGVRVLWPFGIRTCGSCLQKCSEKESALYVSPDCPFFLLSALPFAFVTATNHFVSNAALQNMAHLPPLKMEKHYYKPHIEDIKGRLTEAKALGAPSVEEWMKGLPSEGKERLDDAVRWEQWEARGGLKRVNAKAPTKPSTPAISRIGPAHHSKPEAFPDRSTPQNIPLPAKPSVDSNVMVPPTPADLSFPQAQMMPQFQPTWATGVSHPDGFAQRPPGILSQTQPRPERNIRDVNEAKAMRKAEIERRCQDLEPPLPSSVLNHVESFQAAIQISQPLTDHAWEVLKPRLLAQRPYAERKEKEKIQQDELLQEEYRQRRQQETQLKETKEALDREWDTVQAPVRNRIGALADEVIADKWSNGDSVSKDTSPKFAADVLLYVRERFYADIVREDEEARVAGQSVRVDQPNEPPTRKLILENMKWLFDTKIKPLTENFQKELFLCNGCEGNFKFYGFEGVIQHYAAKHTTSLSMGSVVVHWRAEWPEHPPFNPNPTAAKAAYYKIPTPVSGPVQGPANIDPQQQPYYGYGRGLDNNPVSLPAQPVYHNVQTPAEVYSAASTAPQPSAPYSYPTHQVYPYSTASTGNVPAPPSDPGSGIGYPGPPQSMYSTPNQGYIYHHQPQYNQPNQGYASHYPRPQYPPYTQGQDFSMPSAPLHDPSSQYYGASAIAQQPGSYAPRPITLHPSGLAPDVYQTQLDELAKHAREVWFGTSGIKDIPQSVRIFVVIHHAASRFATSFSSEPTLAMFIDGLDNHPKMRPVRSLNGLACKTCVHASSGDGQQVFLQHPVADRKLYTLPHLLNHFRTAHAEANFASSEHVAAGPNNRPDWKRDMIELPELPLIADLVHAQGVDDTKLGLIASVFPEAFPNPLPAMGKRGGNVGPVPVYRASSMSAHPARAAVPASHLDQSRTTDTPTNYQPFARPVSALRTSGSRAQSSEPPGEDEYDPHRPAYLGKIIRPDTETVSSRHQEHVTSIPIGAEQSPNFRHNQHLAQYYVPNTAPRVEATHGMQPDIQNGEPSQFYRAGNGQATSHENLVNVPSSGRFDEPYTTHSERQTYHDSNQRAYNENSAITRQHPTEHLIPNGDSISAQYTNHVTSPIEAADHFLRSLPVSKASHSGTREQDAVSRSTSAWADGARNVDLDRKYHDNVGMERWNKVQSGTRQATDNYPVIDSIRAASLISKAVEESASVQGFVTKGHQDDEYRPPTHVQLPLGANRIGHSPQSYDKHSSGRQIVSHQQYAVSDMDISREDRASSYQQPRELQYRSRSRSPKPLERGFYRSRSPRVEARNESVYHVISPPLRNENPSQRILGYEYPVKERYQYIDNNGSTEDRYGRRVEYVPLRYEEPRPTETSRYILAPRYEEPAPPQGYVRVEQGYGGEQYYERDGQLYRAGPSTQAYAGDYRH